MAHALRGYRMGAVLLKSGEVQVSRAGIDQEELLAIRHGDFDPKQYDLKLLHAKSRFEEAAEHTRLPPARERYGIAGYGIAYHPRIY